MQQIKDDNKAFADILLSKSIPYARQAGDSIYLGKCFFDLGLTFKNIGQNEKTKEYCNIASKILKEANAPVDQIVAVYIMAAETSVLLNETDEAKKHLESAKKILLPFPESRYVIDYYTSEGMYLNLIGSYNESLASSEKGIVLAKKLNLRYNELRLWLQKYYAYFGKKDFLKAKQVLLFLLDQKDMVAHSVNALQLYKGMALTHAGLADMTLAYEWEKNYSKLSDSIYEGRLKNTINELELKFNNAENQQQILKLQAEKDKALLTSKNNRLLNWLLGIASVSLFSLLTFGWLYYKKAKKLAEQKEINYQQQLEEVNQKQQVAFTKALMQGEEKERKRLAGDLHDGLGGMLSGVKMNLSRLVNTNKENSMNNDLYKVIDQLDFSVTELRRIARNMMPESLLQLGLEASLKDMCHEISSTETIVEFQSFNISKEIPAEMQVTIYRLIQELVTNALRHAAATEILVQCSQTEDTFFITIEDNGKGFDTGSIGTHKGIGLANVKRRVEYLKGKLDISSTEGEGTEINIEFNVSA
jgi:two-component system, NarL family, sensor kinase